MGSVLTWQLAIYGCKSSFLIHVPFVKSVSLYLHELLAIWSDVTDTSLTLFTGLDDSEEEISRPKDMRGMVEEFHQHMLQTAADLKAKHIKEFLHLRKLRNDDAKDDIITCLQISKLSFAPGSDHHLLLGAISLIQMREKLHSNHILMTYIWIKAEVMP